MGLGLMTTLLYLSFHRMQDAKNFPHAGAKRKKGKDFKTLPFLRERLCQGN